MRGGWHRLALCAVSLGVLAAPWAGETFDSRGRRHASGDAGDQRPVVRTTWSARIAAEPPSGEALAGACGDSILDSGEQCDDGNATPGDGCSDTCQIEPGFTCTEPIPPASGTNIVADPSFEAGTPNPSWAEFSSNFLSPICNVVDCGDDGGTGPATGIWWAWFGGFSGGTEMYSLSQSLVIPSGATTLEFKLEQILCDSADDVLEVTLDGAMPALFTTDGASPLCGQLGYSTQSVGISGFADGGSHTLEFSGMTVSTNGGVTDFFVDDVVISDNVPLPPVPSECFPVGPLGCDGSLVDFDTPSAGIPADWTVVDNEGTGVVWTTVAGSGEFGNYTGGTGEAASVSSRTNSGLEFDTELRAPFDLSVIPPGSTATLTYLANYQNSMNSDFLDLDISTDGGTNWINLLGWNEDHGSFLGAPGESVTVDLSAFAGLGGLLLRWRYYDPNIGDSAWYAQIDDVRLTCEAIVLPVPALSGPALGLLAVSLLLVIVARSRLSSDSR
jgi:cysteine-rich repeat protein